MYNSTPAISLDLREASEREGSERVVHCTQESLDARHISSKKKKKKRMKEKKVRRRDMSETNQQTERSAHTDTAPV